jgi:2-polyprenyl-3-methyl-5-hydroxy-6-metoxy-1,4-benzoquinol methylase
MSAPVKNYPSLKRFSQSILIPEEDLVEAFEIEKDFHDKILAEPSKEERIKLYNSLYTTVHSIYKRNSRGSHNNGEMLNRKAYLFSKELKNKSILEVGCGQGAFLKTVAKINPGAKLCGLDVSIPGDEVLKQFPGIDFIAADITEFKVAEKYDVVYSNHVLEHMAPADFHTHLKSIQEALKENGLFIVNMPNRLFGPSDVTRILDFSYSNKINAQGSHFNETTYNELIPVLKQYGFTEFKTVFPHIKLRHLLRSFRMNPGILCKIEQSSFIMKLLHGIKHKGSCTAKFEITLICKKGN